MFVDSFLYNKVANNVSNDVLSSLLYTSGYVARKAMSTPAYTECKDLFGNKHNTMDLQVEQEHLQYTEHIDREGLIYPSNSLFEVMQVAYYILYMYVSSYLRRNLLMYTIKDKR